MLADFRYADRSFRRTPGFTAAAILSLALGIGANTTIFSVVKAVLLQNLPVRDPGRLLTFHRGDDMARISYPDYLDYRAQAGAFEDVAAEYPVVPASLGGLGEPERVWGQLVTPNYFAVVGAEPTLGRGFRAEENHSQVAVISRGLWQRGFAGDPSIIGRTVLLAGAPYTVVGVAPPGFHGSIRGLVSDFWLPLGLYPQVVPLIARRDGRVEETRNYPWLAVDARLKPGVTGAAAQAALDVVAKRLDRDFPRTNQSRQLKLVPAGTIGMAFGPAKLLLGILMAVVGLVLLVACANVANLLLARSAAPQRELGVRFAIGAGRARLVRQMLAESVLLSMLGAVLGTGLAFAGTRALARLQTSVPISVALDLTVDQRVLLFTLALSLVTGILFGFAPAFRGTRAELTAMLREDAAGLGGLRRISLRNGLVVVQVAVSLVLLVVAGLFLRSLQRASSIPLGIRPERILSMAFDPRAAGYSAERAVVLFRQLLEHVRALPNVDTASMVDILPLTILPRPAGLSRPGRNTDPSFTADMYGISPGYFRTLGVELAGGRDFDEHTAAGDPPAIVNEVVVRRLFGEEDPLGQVVALEGAPHRVIAVARNTKSRTPGEPPQAQIYVSLEREYAQFWGFFGVSLMVKTVGDPGAMISPVRRQIQELAPAMAVFNVETMEDHVGKAMLIPRACAWLFATFGLTGLALAAVGLYGVMSYSVRRRTREIGIRMAIGATPAGVVAMLARQGIAVACVGVCAGLVLALGVSGVLAGFLYGVGARDAITFAGVPAFLLLVALVAVLLPARRAATVDAWHSLRSE